MAIVPAVSDEAAKVEVLRDIAAAFDAHDLDRIMGHFADDCVFLSPRGDDPVGARADGADEVRAAFAARFGGIPDVRYTDDTHFVAGDRGVSEWQLTGTTTGGERIEIRGCDIWTFRGDTIVLKNSFWKIRDAR